MLKVFRDNLKKLAWVLWIVIAVFVLLVFTDFQGAQTGAGPTSTAATVAGETITFADFQRRYEVVEDRWREQFGDAYTPEVAQQLGVPMQAMSDLVAEQIVLREARQMGLVATDEEVRDAILEVPALLDAQGRFIGEDEYRRLLQVNRLSVEDFERQIRQQVLLQKFNQVLANSAFVSDAEVERQAREQAETAAIRYLQLSPSAEALEVEVGEEEIVQHFEDNLSEYNLPERRRIGYLSINTNVLRAGMQIPEEDLRAYYDANPDEFTREEQVRAQHILLFVTPDRPAEQAQSELQQVRQRVESGEDFGALARELSEDEATKERGGDLGFFGRGLMTPEFEEAAFGGAEGELIGPVENQLGPRTGYHLIRINAKQPGGVQPFDQVENRIRVRLLNDRSREAAERQARELYSRVQDEVIDGEESLRALAEREGIAVEVTAPVSIDDNLPGIGRGTPFSRAAFEHQPGKLSEPQRIAAGWALLDVLEIEPSRAPELDEVREAVRADALARKRAVAAKERLESARAQIAAGERTFDQVAGSLEVEIKESGSFNADGAITGLGAADDLVAAALALEEGEVGGPIEHAGGPLLFEVSERTHFDPETFARDKEVTRHQLRAERVNALLQSLVERRRTELDVTYSRNFLATFQPEATSSE